MSLLATCSDQTLENIVYRLNASEVLRLLTCGSRILSSKILQSTRQLCFVWRGFGRPRWPKSISQFRYLSEFQLSMDDETPYLPCEGVEIEGLPKTLRSLDLAYFDPVSSIYKPSSQGGIKVEPYDFATHLPALESLRLSGWPPLVSLVGMNFPMTLTRLEISMEETFDGVSMIKDLPSTIKHLKLGMLQGSSDDSLWKFPPELETFDMWCQEQDGNWIVKLPQTVTSISILTIQDKFKYAKYWKDLPRNLKKLSFYGPEESPDAETFLFLPPSLEEMHWSFSSNNQPLKEKETIAPILRALPSSLTNWTFDGFHVPNELLEIVPTGSKTLILADASPLTPLPTNLTNLTLISGSILPQDAESFPQTLKHLIIDHVSDELMSKLERLQLVRLTCKSGKLTPRGCSLMPRTISYLSIDDRIFTDLECLKMIPDLHILTISTPQHTETEHAAFRDLRAARNLPRSLKRLHLFTSKWVTSEWIKGLEETQLRHLSISYILEIDPSILLHLPRSLTSISVNTPKLLDEHLTNLPPNLKLMECGSWSKCELTNKAMALLPQSTYSIDLSECPQLDDTALSLLPNNLFSFKASWEQVSWFSNRFDPFIRLRPSKPSAEEDGNRWDGW
jgi:hypothetical protein